MRKRYRMIGLDIECAGWAVTAFVAANLMGRSTGTLVMVGLVVAVAATLIFV